MSDKTRVGVVGVGYLGRFHALIYSRMPDVSLVGVVDSDPQRAAAVATEAGTRALSPEELLDAAEAVSIVVPTTAHLEIARPFLKRGTHVLLEKPIATTVEEARDIVNLADASGAILQVGHLERFNAGVMALAERIEQPMFFVVCDYRFDSGGPQPLAQEMQIKAFTPVQAHGHTQCVVGQYE